MIVGAMTWLLGSPDVALAAIAAIVLILESITPLITLLRRKEVLRRLGNRVGDIEANRGGNSRGLSKAEVFTVAVLVVAVVIVSILSKTLFAVAAIPLLGFFLRRPLDNAIRAPYTGLYENGVMEPAGAWYFGQVNAYQRNDSTFHYRTRDGATGKLVVTSRGDWLESHFGHLGVRSAIIIEERYLANDLAASDSR